LKSIFTAEIAEYAAKTFFTQLFFSTTSACSAVNRYPK